MVTKLIGVREFRQNMARYCLQAKKNGWQYIILNRNKPILQIRVFTDKEATLEKLLIEKRKK